MTTSSHVHIARGLSGLALATLATSAAAGMDRSVLFTIDTKAGTAYGTLAAVRASNDALAQMNCIYSTSNGGSVSCFARNSAVIVSCYVPSPAPQAYVNALLNLDNDGYLSFAWDANGRCTNITTQKATMFAPKQ